MQGFFVKATSSSGNVTFTNSTKSTAVSYFRSAEVNSLIRLTVKDEQGKIDETVVRIKGQATDEFDGELDAYKLLSADSFTPQLWSEYKETEYSVNSVPDIEDKLILRLKVLPKNPGTHEILLTELKDYNKGLPIYIYDQNFEHGVNIENGRYSFAATAGEPVTLYLAFSNTPTPLDGLSKGNIGFTAKENLIKIYGMNGKGNSVKIFNIDGKIIKNEYLVGSKLEIPVPSNGLYIVKIVPDNGDIFTGKVVVK